MTEMPTKIHSCWIKIATRTSPSHRVLSRYLYWYEDDVIEDEDENGTRIEWYISLGLFDTIDILIGNES